MTQNCAPGQVWSVDLSDTLGLETGNNENSGFRSCLIVRVFTSVSTAWIVPLDSDGAVLFKHFRSIGVSKLGVYLKDIGKETFDDIVDNIKQVV